MRAFCDINKPLQKNMKAGDAASLILAKASVTAVDFTVPAALKGPKKQVLRFAPNPGTSTNTTNTIDTSFIQVLFRSQLHTRILFPLLVQNELSEQLTVMKSTSVNLAFSYDRNNTYPHPYIQAMHLLQSASYIFNSNLSRENFAYHIILLFLCYLLFVLPFVLLFFCSFVLFFFCSFVLLCCQRNSGARKEKPGG
jgi:hypothetical protein